MPRDLFGDVVARPSRARVHRTLTIYSVALHLVVISGVLAAQVLAPDPLPVLHQPLTFEDFTLVKVVDVPAAPLPRRTATEPPPAVSPNAAPPVAPSGITPETGREATRNENPGPAIPGGVEGVRGLQPIGVVEGPPPPPPAPTPQTPIRLYSGMDAPVKTVHVAPIYPAIAQTARVQGVVILEAIIDTGGTVTSVKILRSIPLLDQAAADAVRQWRFTPGKLNGQVVPVVMTVTVNFQLDR